MSGDDWLWDGKGEPDPVEARLSASLAPLAYGRPAPSLASSRRWRAPAAALLLAAAALLGAALVWRTGEPPWSMHSAAGCPGGDCTLMVGREVTFIAETRVVVADLGRLVAAPGSQLGLVRSDAEEHRLSLQSGQIDVVVDAPPRRLIVETPAVRVVDLGCAYGLAVDPARGVEVQVRAGRVALESAFGSTLVPAGALGQARPDGRLLLPRFVDANAAFVAASQRLDADATDADALMALLAEARPQDALTLWHLLPRLEPGGRQQVWAALLRFDPQLDPAFAAVIDGDEPARLRLRDELEFLWRFGG